MAKVTKNSKNEIRVDGTLVGVLNPMTGEVKSGATVVGKVVSNELFNTAGASIGKITKPAPKKKPAPAPLPPTPTRSSGRGWLIALGVAGALALAYFLYQQNKNAYDDSRPASGLLPDTTTTLVVPAANTVNNDNCKECQEKLFEQYELRIAEKDSLLAECKQCKNGGAAKKPSGGKPSGKSGKFRSGQNGVVITNRVVTGNSTSTSTETTKTSGKSGVVVENNITITLTAATKKEEEKKAEEVVKEIKTAQTKRRAWSTGEVRTN
ncbi:MAG: hypothetical protein LBJ18_00475 [Rickettsiales bacterium]|jgi:hypothetical protein|nr:hypothetical protein [Rickettsiales bacterium]